MIFRELRRLWSKSRGAVARRADHAWGRSGYKTTDNEGDRWPSTAKGKVRDGAGASRRSSGRNVVSLNGAASSYVARSAILWRYWAL